MRDRLHMSPREWATTTVGEFCPFTYGKSLPKGKRCANGEVPVFGSNGVVGYHDHALTGGATVIVGRKGTVGVARYSIRPCWPIDTTFYVTGQDPALVRFRYYALSNLGLEKANADSAVPGLNRGDAHAHRMRVPREAEQRRIVGVLGALDDKIELNQRMNEALESMAQSLFESWFVTFEAACAKARRTAYTLADLGQHHTGTVAPNTTPQASFEHFSIPAFDADQAPKTEQGDAIKSNKTLVPPHSVLLSKLNPDIPRVWIPPKSNGTCQICSTEFLAFTPLAPANRALLYGLFRSGPFRTMLQSMVTGTSRSHQRVPPQALKSQQVLSGTPELFRLFGERATPLLHRTMVNRHESRLLAAIRDALLPRLISGTLRVSHAERIVDSVL